MTANAGSFWRTGARPEIGELAALGAALPSFGAQRVGQTETVVAQPDLAQAEHDIAQANAQVVAFSEGAGDLVASLRAAGLDGWRHQATLVAPLARIADIDHAGPAAAEGLVVVAPSYWDSNDATRAFARRWSDRMAGEHVTENAAEVYAATLSFVQAAKAADAVDSATVMRELRRAPIRHTMFGTVTIRADGQAVHDIGVYRVKTPAEIRHRWEYYQTIARVPGDRVFAAGCGAPGAH